MINQHQKDFNNNQFDGDTILDQIAQTLSPEIARLIHFHFAGTELNIPKKIKPNHEIYQRLGEKNARLLTEFTGGDIINIPMKLPKSREYRNEHIKRLALQGVPRLKIAQQMGISQRHVRRLLSQMGLANATGVRTENNATNPISCNSNGGLTVQERYLPRGGKSLTRKDATASLNSKHGLSPLLAK